jgi:phosphoribosyl-ATP pyrophosphohydrolase/phosphoribosyl-AMP cyclohydrolase
MMRRTDLSDRTLRIPADLDGLSFWENGLLPVVAQDVETEAVLMVAFANREALAKTLETGQMHYWSRSRQELWHKGATSGNYQDLVSLHADCDGDTLLARVRQLGPACHTGESTCFGAIDSELLEGDASPRDSQARWTEDTLPELWAVLRDRVDRRPTDSYTVKLLEDENLRLKKLGEETAELILALARNEKAKIPQEAADLVYHLLVALLASGTTLEDLLAELDTRKA